MSSPQGQVAGRLSVVVESWLGGFRKELEKKVEAASKGVKAKVGVEINEEGLRKALETKVSEASAGVNAKVGIDLDSRTLKSRVEAAAKAAASRARVVIETVADHDGLTADVAAASAAAEAGATDVKVPLSARIGRFFADIAKARAEGQALADASGGIKIPLAVDDGSSLFGGGRRGFRMRTLFRGSVIFGLISLVEPAVGAIGQIVAGLTAMAGAAAPAAGTLAAIPIGIAGIIQTAAAGKIAMQGMSDAMGLLAEKQATLARGEEWTTAQQEKLTQVLDELSPSARRVAKEVVGLRSEWVAMRKGVQERFFSNIVGDVRPLAERWLPLLEKRLGGTADVLGRNAHSAAQWSMTAGVQSDMGKVMANNNVILGDFMYMVGELGKGSLDFLVSSRRFGRGFGGMMRDVGDWFSGKMERGRETGSTEAFLDRATDKATQLWHITQQLGGGLAGIFRAGTGTGDSLLDRFDDFLTDWHAWVDSPEGQQYLTDWFEATEEGFVEASKLINDAFKGMAKWAADPKIVELLHQLRTELGPALGDFLKNLSDDAAPGVIDFLTQLMRTIEHLEPAIEIIGNLAQVINHLLDALNDLADMNPAATENVAKALGAFILLGNITRLGRLAGVLGTAGVAGKAGKAGLLARLFGSASDASKTAKGVSATAAATGKLGGVLGTIARSPFLKKAGLVGGLLTGIDIATDIKDWYQAGGKRAEAITKGFTDGVGSSAARQAVADAFTKTFTDSDRGGAVGLLDGNTDLRAFADKVGIDVERLTDEIATLGTTGDYYKATIKKLNEYGSLWKNPFYGLPGVDTDQENAKTLREQIEAIADDAVEAIEDAKQRMNDAARGANPLRNLLLFPEDPTRGYMPKPVKPPKAPSSVMNEFVKPPKQPQIKVPFRAPSIMDDFAPPSTKKWEETFETKIPAIVRRGMSKVRNATKGSNPLKNAGFDKAQAQARQWAAGTEKAARRATTAVRNSSKQTRNAVKQQGEAFEVLPRKAKKAVEQTTKAAGDLTRSWKSKTKDLPKATEKSMDGVVKAVRNAKGPAKTASTQVGTGVKQPLSSLRGPLQTAGENAMDGFKAGIESAGDRAVAAAAAVAARVAAATRKALDIHSPSRVMKKLGEWTIKGFELGLRGGIKKVQRVQKGLWERLTDRKFSKERIRAMKARFADEFKAIREAAKKRDALNDRLDRAQNRLSRLRSERSTFKSTLRAGAEEYGDIGSIAQANGGFANVSWLIGELKDRAKNSKRFRAIINRLRKKGLSKRALQQIVDLGMEDGLPIAQQLVQGSAAEIKKINKLQGIISEQAKKLGKETSKALWDSGIKAGAALVRSLKRRQKEMNKVAERMAQALVNELRRALGLKVTKQMVKDAQGPKKGGGKKDDDDKPKKPPKGGGGSASKALADAGRASSRKRPRRAAGAAAAAEEGGVSVGGGAAPLVGELHLHGVTQKNLPGLLDEAYFGLRKIRQGGIYADRVA